MAPRTWMMIGCAQAGLAVVLGAFAAHALKADLESAGQLANWHTAVHYQMWHALALLIFGLWRTRQAGTAFPGWAFLIGSLFFSGSIYALALDFARPVMGPITPLGGSLLIAGWITLAVSAARSREA